MGGSLSLRQVRIRVASVIALTWLIPTISFKLFFVVSPLPDYLQDLIVVSQSPHLWWYTMIFLGVTLYLVDRQVLNLDKCAADSESSMKPARKALGRLVVTGGNAMFLYLLGGAAITVLSSETSLLDMTPLVFALLVLATSLLFIYIAIPAYIYGFSVLGQRYGPALSYLKYSSWRIKMLLSGPAVVLITVIAYTAYVFVYSQALSGPLVILGCILFSYALVVSLLTDQSYRTALKPLTDFLSRDSTDADPNMLKPVSADETGLAVEALQRLVIEIKQSEERFRQFAEATSDYFFEIDKDLKFSYLSERYEEITNMPAENVLGLAAPSMSAVYEVDDFDEHASDLKKYRPYRNYTFAVALPDGREMHLSVSAVPHFAEDGSFLGYRGAGSDVTQLVETQKTLDEQTRLLLHSQKMDAVGQLTGGIAHDFNNLLTVIIGNVEMLRLSDDEQANDNFITQALSAANNGATLVKRLLAYSRRQPLNLESTDLGQLIDDMLDLMGRSLGENINIEFIKPETTVSALVDAQQLENAILNLAINARDAMPDGGNLKISLSLAHISNEMNLKDGNYCLIQIEDNGIGIDEETQELVFEPFFTTKDIGKGSGLGLSTVYGMIKQSHGDVRIQSTPGHGTTVSLYLPVSKQDNDKAEPGQESQVLPSTGSEHILVVEDDDPVRELIARQVDGLGYRVTAVSQAEQALDLISEVHDFDLVLTDVVLSGTTDGIDLSHRLETLSPQTPVLFLTGYTDRMEQIDPARLVTKPFRLRELAIKLATTLEKARKSKIA